MVLPGVTLDDPSSPDVKLGRTLIDATTLQAGVARLASEIDRDQNGRQATLVGILKGSIFFLCDLVKKLETPVKLDFLQVSSYGSGTESSGNVRLFGGDPLIDVAGQEVVIVEDIVDTGRTLQKIIALLSRGNPKSIRICTLLRKRTPESQAISLDYLGFEIDNHFVVGYGLDYAEAYRNLPYIAILEREGRE